MFDGLMDRRGNGWMRWTDAHWMGWIGWLAEVDGWMDRRIDGRIYRRGNGWRDGRMDERMDERTNIWTVWRDRKDGEIGWTHYSSRLHRSRSYIGWMVAGRYRMNTESWQWS